MNELLDKHKACRTHCCIIHGCKYGHEDCPVVLGVVKQEYLCESCSLEINDYTVFVRVNFNTNKKLDTEKQVWNKINKIFLRENRKLKLNKLK